MITVLATAGTSIAQGCKSLPQYFSKRSTWDDRADDLRAEIDARLRDLDLSIAEGRIRASAELNSLHRLGLTESDRVILLATDTAEGRTCAEAVKRAVVEAFGVPENQVRVERVEGLQVSDAERVRRVGLPNLVKSLLRHVRDPQLRYAGELVLNPTGGFKGVVPFLTVVGMLFRLRTVYVFETAPTLISLPPLPITFDLDLFERARPALELVQRETAVAAERFFNTIDGFEEHERELFEGFLERDIASHEVTLSPLALILTEIEQDGGRRVFVGPNVDDRGDSAKRRRLSAFLENLAKPLWRSQHGHTFHGTSLKVFGESRQPARAACVLQDDSVYVCELWFTGVGEHERYETELSGKNPSDYDLTKFAEWTPPDEGSAVPVAFDPDVGADATLTPERQRQEIEELQRELEKARSKSQKAFKRNTKLSKAIMVVQGELLEHCAALRRVEAGNEDFARTLERLTALCTELERIGSGQVDGTPQDDGSASQ